MNLAIAVILLLLGTLGVLGKPVLSAVILLAFCRYGPNGFYELTASATAQTASGVVGCSSSPPSTGASPSASKTCSTVLPFGRRMEAREAMEGGVAEQIGPVEQEAGVREQLQAVELPKNTNTLASPA